MATTRKALDEAIAICKPGVPFREIGNKIEEITKPKGYGIVRRYVGHGIHQRVSEICQARYLCVSAEPHPQTKIYPLTPSVLVQAINTVWSHVRAILTPVPLEPTQHRALRRLQNTRKDGSRTGLYDSKCRLHYNLNLEDIVLTCRNL
jgi:hypothetical protein